MKIALIGRGKTGSEIEQLVIKSQHHLVSVSTKSTGLDLVGIQKADVVIDFSSPDAVIDTIKRVSSMKKNMVIGTSGWYAQLDLVEKIVKKESIGLIYAQNFSIGTNIFFQVVAYTAALCHRFGNYDVYGFEIHHKGKIDSPSGTAFRIAQEVLQNFPTKKTIQTEKLDRKIKDEELHFVSARAGRNPGMHQVVFDSDGDQLTLSEQSHNRRVYAEGAVMAAEFIKNKKGLYSFDQLFQKKGKNS